MAADTSVDRHKQLALLEIASELRGLDAYRRSGHTARTLLKAGDLRLVLVVMRAGARLAEHSADTTAIVHVVSGAVTLDVEGEPARLSVGQVLVMEAGVKHTAEAEEDSAFLLTLGWARGA